MPAVSPLNNPSGLPLDPETMQALQQEQLMNNIERGGMTTGPEQNAYAINQGVANLFPSPEVQRARREQQLTSAATLTQNDGESDLDFSIRQTRAQRDAIAAFDPARAAALNTQLLKLSEAQFEQTRLKAADQREQATFDAGAGKRQEEAATGSLAYVITPNAKSQLGYDAQAYDTSKPDDVTAMTAAAKKPGAQVMSADRAAQLFNSSNSADMKVAGQLAKAAQQQAAGTIPPEALPQAAVDSIVNPSLYSGRSVQAKNQLETFYAQKGILPSDIAGARLEYKALSSSASQVGRREGNIKILQNSLGQMGDQVNQSLQGLTRTDFAPLNALIMAGKTQFSDAGEARYAAAVQTFVNEYARLIAGGSGTSTEGARKEAWATLNKAQGPSGIAAAVQQMAVRETQIVMGAGDAAVEYFARPGNYKSLAKIQEKAGLSVPMPSNADLSVTNPQAPAPSNTPPPPAGGPPPAPPKVLTYDPASGSFK